MVTVGTEIAFDRVNLGRKISDNLVFKIPCNTFNISLLHFRIGTYTLLSLKHIS
jgi:hypothetical protein